jgi:hypothetical protein
MLSTPAPFDRIISTIITAVHSPTTLFIFPFPFWRLTDLDHAQEKQPFRESYAPNVGRIDK